MEEIIINVEGMACAGCENRVHNALKTIEGVECVVASYADGTVRITLNNEVDIDVLKGKIEDLGFDVKED